MNVLVFNCGSSSLNARLYEQDGSAEPRSVAIFKAQNVQTKTSAAPKIHWRIDDLERSQTFPALTHHDAAAQVLRLLEEQHLAVDAVGHRFVHGGDHFQATARIEEDALKKLRACFPLAPIHNPNSYAVIEVCLEKLPEIPQYAVFDTAFHANLPPEARAYALPRELAQKSDYHKVGFHGLSCQYVSARAAELLNKPLDQVKLILCHLGTGGSSVTAFAGGRSIDTSMGYSPLAGLVMSTRCGDLDPGILLELVRAGRSADEIEQLLNHESGLIGLSGYSSNLAEVIERAEGGDEACRLAFAVYAHRLRHYLGAFLYQLNGAHAVVFTDGIGVSSWQLREKACENAENLGLRIDRETNRNADPQAATWIHDEGSKVKLLVLPTDEERVILEEVVSSL